MDRLGAKHSADIVAAARSVAARKEGRHAVIGDLGDLHAALTGAMGSLDPSRNAFAAALPAAGGAATAAANRQQLPQQRAAADAVGKRVQSRKGRAHARCDS